MNYARSRMTSKRRSEVDKALWKFVLDYSQAPPQAGCKMRRSLRIKADRLVMEYLKERLESGF